MGPLPRLQAVKAAPPRSRRRVKLDRGGEAAAAACLVAGLAGIAAAAALIYLPAGLLVAGLELAGGAIAYTLGARTNDRSRR